MASCSFPEMQIYQLLCAALLEVAQQMQGGKLTQAKTLKWMEGECLQYIEGDEWEYVCGNDDINFAGTDTGDWEALCRDVRAAMRPKKSTAARKAVKKKPNSGAGTHKKAVMK